MSIVAKLASQQGDKSDVPNQELADELAANNDISGIQEIAQNLWTSDKAIQSDCIKVLYEIGYQKPALIADYWRDFIKLLKHPNNRLVWGSMIALSTIADIKAGDLFDHRDAIQNTIEKGSVITRDAGIKALSLVAASKDNYKKALFPYLLETLKNCRPKSVAQYAESILQAVTDANKSDYIKVLNERKDILNPSQSKRVQKILTKLQ